MKVVIERVLISNKNTIGNVSVYDDNLKMIYRCHSLELPDNNNIKKKSSIPFGSYDVIKHNSPSFGNCFKVLNVPDRSDILIHVGNYTADTLGCILVGSVVSYDSSRCECLILKSRATLNNLLASLPHKFQLEIQ